MKAKHTLIIYTIGNTRGLGQRAPWKREDDGGMEAGDFATEGSEYWLHLSNERARCLRFAQYLAL